MVLAAKTVPCRSAAGDVGEQGGAGSGNRIGFFEGGMAGVQQEHELHPSCWSAGRSGVERCAHELAGEFGDGVGFFFEGEVAGVE